MLRSASVVLPQRTRGVALRQLAGRKELRVFAGSPAAASFIWRAGQRRSTTTFSSSASTATTATNSSSNSSDGNASGKNAPLSHYLSHTAAAAIAAASLAIGFAAGRRSSTSSSSTIPEEDHAEPHNHHHHTLPNGLPRTCCDDRQPDDDHQMEWSAAQKDLPRRLGRLVGAENVMDCCAPNEFRANTARYLQGARLGGGPALCVVTPRKLHHVPEIVELAVRCDCAVLPQGQNTGLTGGSVPRSSARDGTVSGCAGSGDAPRPVVVLSMKHLDGIFPLDDGKRVVCMAGVGLASLQEFLNEHFPDRESHSVLGSTFLNPTTAAGVAFGSGGTQCRKGPAYTERALYVKVATNKWREQIVETVNTLNVHGLEERQLPPGRARKHMDSVAYRVDTWSRWLRDGYERSMRHSQPDCQLPASNTGYAQQLCRRRNSRSVSRWNADPSGPDPCRSEGKVVILATVHDTFPKPKSTQTFWLSFDSLETALEFRKTVCLDNADDLPVSVEYMDRDAFDVVDRSGRVLGNVIKYVGTASPAVRQLWNLKLWVEALPGADHIVDKFMHIVNPVAPAILPDAVMEMGRRMDHHVALTVGDFGDGNMERLLDRLQRFASHHGRDKIAIYACQTPREAQALTAFRFVAAPAFRTWCIGEGVQGVSVDYALPQNGGAAPPLSQTNSKSGTTAAAQPVKRMRYSHFACNVVHEDLAYAPGVDVHEAKHAFKHAVEFECGGKLPAEHGHGTEYVAPPETQERWKKMDPLNVLNPGIGGLSEKVRYQD